MNYGKTLHQVALDVAEIKGCVKVLANDHQHTAAEVKKVEGRQWGLVVAVLLSFLSSILALIFTKPSGLASATHAVFEFFTF